MINQITRNLKIFLVFTIILYLCSNTYAGEGRKCERPGHLFSPLKIPLLEDAERDTWQKPEKILHALEIEKGQVVADVGAGSGYLTVRLSERVGITGTVYAVDVQQEMLNYISKRLRGTGLKNVITILSDMDDPKLPAKALDIAILLSTYHEIAQPIDFIKKIKPALKPNGKLAVLEFTEESPIGPPLPFRLPEDIVIREIMQAGFILSEKLTFLLPYQYVLIFTSSHE